MYYMIGRSKLCRVHKQIVRYKCFDCFISLCLDCRQTHSSKHNIKYYLKSKRVKLYSTVQERCDYFKTSLKKAFPFSLNLQENILELHNFRDKECFTIKLPIWPFTIAKFNNTIYYIYSFDTSNILPNDSCILGSIELNKLRSRNIKTLPYMGCPNHLFLLGNCAYIFNNEGTYFKYNLSTDVLSRCLDFNKYYTRILPFVFQDHYLIALKFINITINYPYVRTILYVRVLDLLDEESEWQYLGQIESIYIYPFDYNCILVKGSNASVLLMDSLFDVYELVLPINGLKRTEQNIWKRSTEKGSAIFESAHFNKVVDANYHRLEDSIRWYSYVKKQCGLTRSDWDRLSIKVKAHVGREE